MPSGPADEGIPDEAHGCPHPPTFDRLDLPEGMEAMGFHQAAHCARRWFNGKARAIEKRRLGA